MLTRFDDYPLHQTPEPIAHPVSNDRNVYDRYWFNGFAADGSLYFGVALGLYPNRRVMDCAFSVVRGGEQWSFHGSRRAPQERDELQVGPFRIEILEPMQRLRIVLEDNDSGLSCELTFDAVTVPLEEDRQRLVRNDRVFMDVTRFTQFGRWSGWLKCGGQRLEIAPAQIRGIRDRSWGVRPVGEPESGGAPVAGLPQLYFLWAPLHWDDGASHVCVFEDAQGRHLHAEGKRVGLASNDVERMVRVDHQIRYAPGTRRMTQGELHVRTPQGESWVVRLEPLLRFHMKGLGYRHPQWAHGLWKGELALGADRWRLDELPMLDLHNVHIQQVVRATEGDRVGYGIVEQLCIGPHAPSGFRAFLDGA
ncbi:MAG: hypothetical protein RLZ51_1960 [Pseudomonadota bacterium]